MARRKRCQGPCGDLYDPGVLMQVGDKLVCDACLAKLDTVDKVDEPPEPSVLPGVPDPNRETEEEKAARLAEIRGKLGLPETVEYLPPQEDPNQMKVEEYLPGVTTGTGQPVSASIAAKFSDSARATGDIHPEQPVPDETTDGQGILGVPISVRDRVPPAADLRDWWRDEGVAQVRPPDWPLRKARLSPSSVASLLRCPEAFRLKYVLGRPEQTNHNMIRGAAIHQAAEENWRYKVAHGDDMPPRDWEVAYLDHFADQVSDAGGFGAVQWKGKPAELRDEALPAVRGYAEQIAPTVEPLATERPFAVKVPGVPVPVCGVIDVVTTEGVLDYKFGRNRAKEIRPEWRAAAMIYARAENTDVIYHSGNWGGSFYTPDEQPGLRMALTPAVHQVAGDIVRGAVRTIRALTREYGTDEPWPHALLHQYACSGCSFREDGSCRWWHPVVETI